MGKSQQRKGRAAELDLTRILREYGYDVQPGQAVSYGATPDIVGLPGVHCEVKRAQQQNLYGWMEPALSLLSSMGYVREEERATGGRGRPSKKVVVNPLSKNSRNNKNAQGF